jgi:hypothetical protein
MAKDSMDQVSQFLHVLEGKKIRPATYREFEAFWGQFERRLVGLTQIEETEISTVFTGVDTNMGGPPNFFHTKIFGGPLNGKTWWYSTYEEAYQGHHAACEEVINSL